AARRKQMRLAQKRTHTLATEPCLASRIQAPAARAHGVRLTALLLAALVPLTLPLCALYARNAYAQAQCRVGLTPACSVDSIYCRRPIRRRPAADSTGHGSGKSSNKGRPTGE
ncbi:hypothetical protein GGI05_006973, partial [Coemansia sp. RSA 2603]